MAFIFTVAAGQTDTQCVPCGGGVGLVPLSFNHQYRMYFLLLIKGF